MVTPTPGIGPELARESAPISLPTYESVNYPSARIATKKANALLEKHQSSSRQQLPVASSYHLASQTVESPNPQQVEMQTITAPSLNQAVASLTKTTTTNPGATYTRLSKRLSKQKHDEAAAKAGYIDALIDPDIEEDDFASMATPAQDSFGLGQLDHSLQLLSLYRDDGNYFDGTLDYGLHYIGRINTVNWGQIRVNAIALDEYRDYQGPAGVASNYYQHNSGIRRLSVEQYGLPITDNISMDNIWGSHRQARYSPYRARPNLVNTRFSAAEPDIQGMSSNLRFGRSSVSLSGGDLGRTQGSILPGFRETEGEVRRGQFTHTRERNAFSGEVWRTKELENLDNRRGYRLGYDRLLGDNTTVSFTTVASGDNRAHLLGSATQTEFDRHEMGLYWFDPDIVWLDTKIGDDNGGAFYRYTGHRGTFNWGSSVELRRDGISSEEFAQRDTSFFSLNLANRLTRRSSLSGAYSFRRVTSESANAIEYNEHNVRTFYTLTHRHNARSSMGIHMRNRGTDSEVDLNYGWSKDLRGDSSAEIEGGYRLAQVDSQQAQEYRVAARWNKQFYGGQFLSMGLGYTAGTSAFDDNQGFTGFFNFDSPITTNLGLSLQLDYSRSETNYIDQDISSTLFTNNQFDDERFSEHREFTALLKLSFRLNGNGGNSAISNRGRRSGAGGVRGIVFVDRNNDGVRQANEPGVKGITLFLNSVYPTVTDANGEYRFPAVGIGEHFLMIDETALPLPWSLKQGEFMPVSVSLRRTTTRDIPLSTISLADAD